MTHLADTGSGHAVQCHGCGVAAATLDPTDLPPDWAARLVHGTQVRHYCPACDPGPALAARYRPDPGGPVRGKVHGGRHG